MELLMTISLSVRRCPARCRGLGRLEEFGRSDRLPKLRSRSDDRLLASIRPEGELLRPDERDIRDPHETQKSPKMRLLRIHRLGRTIAVEAAARLDDDGALAPHQAHRTVFAVAECDARTQHVIEPSL